MFGRHRKRFIKQKKYTPDPEHYPLDTCRNFINFVKDHRHLTDIELANRVLSVTNKRIKAADVLDLVQTTRADLPKQNNLVE